MTGTPTGAGIEAPRARGLPVASWHPVGAAVLATIAGVVLHQALAARDRVLVERAIAGVATTIRVDVLAWVEPRVESLVAMGRRWERRQGTPQDEWADDARAYTAASWYRAIAWIDANYRLRWIVPLDGAEATVSANLGATDQMRAAVQALIDRRTVTVTRTIGAGRETFAVVVPLWVEGRQDGLLMGTLPVGETFDRAVERGAPGYALRVFDGENEIYAYGDDDAATAAAWGVEADIEFYGVTWRARLWPGPPALAGLQSPLPELVLGASIAAGLLAALTLGLARRTSLHARAADRARRALEAEMSERARAQQDLAELNRALEQKVEDRTAALAEHAEGLARSNARLEQFAYVASHDLQEPLRMVASYTELLAQRYRGRLDERADKYIGYAVEGATRMRQLINDLLAYSRVGTRGKPPEPVDAAGVVEQVLRDLQFAVRESRAVVTCDPLPTVLADGTQVRQLFQNLIGNALKFHGETPPSVHVAAERDDGWWTFAVRDNGIGFEMRHAERIFDVFSRLHARDRYDGTGIGLAIAKSIVERHGGRIWAESAPGEGATFRFTLRAPDAPEVAA